MTRARITSYPTACIANKKKEYVYLQQLKTLNITNASTMLK